MSQIKFGTDGWRAVIAEGFTFENVRVVAQATADYWNANPIPGTEKKVMIGYDRRFLSDQFAAQSAEVFCGNGFDVFLSTEPVPTPSVSFAVKAQRAIGGVMITASHNPPMFNGFKLKSHFGGSAESTTCQAIEKLLGHNPVRILKPDAARTSGSLKLVDFRGPHFSALKKLVDFKLISCSRIRFAHEALFGVGAGCFNQILEGTSCKVTTLNGEHDVLFGGINPEPIEKNYGRSSAWLKQHPQDICVVTDGDADRVGGMDGVGRYLSTHQIICLLLHHFVNNRKGRGRVVKALTTTSMVDKMCKRYNLEMTETGVGFKYIAAEMIRGGVMLGAEESGGIGFAGHIPERDGIAAGLMLLELLACEHRAIDQIVAELEKDFGAHRYDRIDMHFPLEKRGDLMKFLKDHPPARLLNSAVREVKSYDGVKYVAENSSWLMLRGSGTEPILRIYAEASSTGAVKRLLKQGVELTRKV